MKFTSYRSRNNRNRADQRTSEDKVYPESINTLKKSCYNFYVSLNETTQRDTNVSVSIRRHLVLFFTSKVVGGKNPRTDLALTSLCVRASNSNALKWITRCGFIDNRAIIATYDTTISQYTHKHRHHYCLSHQADNVMKQWQCACVYVCARMCLETMSFLKWVHYVCGQLMVTWYKTGHKYTQARCGCRNEHRGSQPGCDSKVYHADMREFL